MPSLDIITSAYNEEECLPELFRRICNVMTGESEYDFRLIVIDNGSVDRTWELIFHEDNPKLEYEKLRLSYMDGENQRIYITDFVDFDNKIIYEIKPSSELNQTNFLNKKKYTEEWCSKNKFLYKVITEKDYNFYGRK